MKLIFKEKRTAWNWRGWWRASKDSFIYRRCFKQVEKKYFVGNKILKKNSQVI